MSVDPSLALQGAIYAALSGHSPQIAGGRIYDFVPDASEFPYVVIGDGQSIANRADCYDGTESFIQIDVWSRAVGFPEAKGIADLIRYVLDQDEFAMTGHTLELFDWQDTQFVRDPDGITRRAIMSFRALSQPAD